MAAPHSIYLSNDKSTSQFNAQSTLSDPIRFNGFTVLPIPILGDNYSYLLVDDATSECAVVDPADAKTVHESISQFNGLYHSKQSNKQPLSLKAILTTHKHWDHAGGNNEFVSINQSNNQSNLTVYGHSIDNVDGCTHAFDKTDKQPVETFKLGELTINVLFTPCHTKGHVCYHIQSNNQSNNQTINQCVFTGDTLFIAGCGKFFEGSASQMMKNLYETLGSLENQSNDQSNNQSNNQVAVFCGHEYTLSNLEFATWAEPDNRAIKDKLDWARKQRTPDQSNNQSIPLSTLFTTIGEEKSINPFMRCDQAGIQARVAPWMKTGQEINVVNTLAALRQAKDEQAHKKANL